MAAFVLGGLLGLLIGWLLGRGRAVAPSDNRVENELRQQVSAREAELGQLRSQLTETSNARAAAEARHAASEKMLVDLRALHERARQEAKAAQDKALVDLREAFKALSAD